MQACSIDIGRVRARHLALQAKWAAENKKPPTRNQARAWLEPIRRAMREIKTGEIDAHRGYAVTRIHHCDNDVARVDHCINGFVAMIMRLDPGFDVMPLIKVSQKLEAGVLLTVAEVDRCFAVLNQCETMLLGFSRNQLKDAALAEQINIELEMLGIK